MKDLPLSFHMAWELCSHIESLPSGPQWTYRVVSSNHETKDPVYLYYRNTLDCVKLLFNHPLFADNMDFSPYRLFTSGECDVRVYTKWMSSDSAWEVQVSSEHRILTSSINRPFTTGKYSRLRHIMWYHLVIRSNLYHEHMWRKSCTSLTVEPHEHQDACEEQGFHTRFSSPCIVANP